MCVCLKARDITILAVERRGLHYTESRVQDIRLNLGDLLLVQLPWEKLEQVRGDSDLIVVEDVNDRVVHPNKAPLAGLIFAGVVTLAASGMLNIMVSALAGVFLMLITRCLDIRDAISCPSGQYFNVDRRDHRSWSGQWKKQGPVKSMRNCSWASLRAFSPGYILGAFLLLTSISTQILSNNATAVLLLPIAISTALEIGVNPAPFIMAVCIGASACFATPIGYQTNLMVYGPGAYRFSDYLKMGIPLNLIVLATGSILIPIFWPF